jgi:diguanylate cyclase (GGDEF)-like protein
VDKKSSKIAMFRAFHDRFTKELPVRLDAIQQAWEKDKSGAISGEFYRLVHSLVGSAGTFGFPLLGKRAQALELYLRQLNSSSISAETYTAIEQGITELRQLAKDGPDIQPPNHDPYPSFKLKNQKQALIYLLEDDVDLADELARQLINFGYLVEVFNNVTELKSASVKKLPDVLLFDIHLPEGEDAGTIAAAELRKNLASEPPVIFISGYDSWQDRLNAVRAGGQSFLCKPINMALLLDELENALNQDELKPIRVLIVDDTVLLAEHYSEVLKASGMQTEVLNRPHEIFDKLSGFRPDLILMDVYMPGCSGVEAAKIIRQNPIYSNLPVVYLSSEKELGKQLDAGGDGFLTKPISDVHLVKAVRNGARRFQEMKDLMTQDSLTGLLNHINFKLVLEREISLAERRSSPLSVVMLDIDNFKTVNDTYGHLSGDTVIKSLARLLTQRLRKADVAARYGGEEFAVVLPDTPVDDAFELLDELRQQFAVNKFTLKDIDFYVTFSAGISTYQPDKSVDDLIADADCALYQAKHAGRNQVHFKGID